MSAPTPETISIMKIESGSTRMLRPTSKLPASSQVQAVERCVRSSGCSPRIEKNATAEATNDVATDRVAR